jgi:hypothetical protein
MAEHPYDQLAAKIASLTVYPRAEASHPATTEIVLVPPSADLAVGFDRSQELLAEGRQVRLVGSGVTLTSVWPDWVHQSDGLLLTELGAYHTGQVAAATLAVRQDIEAWLNQVFADVVPGLPCGQVFYASAANRFLQPVLSAMPVLLGLVGIHGTARFHCVDESWAALEVLRYLVSGSGGTMTGGPSSRPVPWAAQIAVLGTAALVAAVVDVVRWYLKAGPSRARLRELRIQSIRRPNPSLWVVLVPDWMRANRHVLESVVPGALDRADPLGVLLFISLNPGMRSEANMRAHVGDELWPGLGALRDSLSRCVVDQITAAESLPALARVTALAVGRSTRVLFRLATRPAAVRRGAFHLDLSRHWLSVIKLATQDVARTAAAEQATRAVVARHDLRGAHVVCSNSTFAPEAASDLLLQAAGATTIDFYHGAGDADWVGSEQSRSSIRCVWTYADAEANQGFGQPTIVAGMPRTIMPNRRAAGTATQRVLIMSNYCHRATRIGSRWPQLPFQNELLRLPGLLRQALGERFQFRWRPHPADNEGAVQQTFAQTSGVEISRGRPLEEDVAWAEIIVSSVSSAAIEALLAEVPVFLHCIPEYSETPVVLRFHPSRRFVWARDLALPFGRCVEALDAGDAGALAPERETRFLLFGPGGEPESLEDLLFRQNLVLTASS